MSAVKKARKKPIKKYRVDLDLKYSYDFVVSGRTAAEAKKAAFDKLMKKLKQRDFNIWADLE